MYDEIIGLSDRQADLRNALLCQLIGNIHRDPGTLPLTLDDFLLFRAPEPPPSPDEVDAALRRFLDARVQP